MRARVKAMLLKLDTLIARCSVGVREEQGILLTFLFHSLFEETTEPDPAIVDPQQGITVEMFRSFLGHFQDRGYEFVSPAAISKGLRPGGKHVLVTFDDGYYNIIRALPVLEQFGAPAVLFPSSDHVRLGKAFWWDVVERHMYRRGHSRRGIRDAFMVLLRLKTSDAEAKVMRLFGLESLQPLGDLDRPFTPAELRDFANHSLVSVGNHTKDHAILPNYPSAEIRAQIQDAQDDLKAMVGKAPEIIAYPCGQETPEIVDAARSVGLRFGVGVAPGWNRLPLRPGSRDAMTLKRFTLWGDRAIEPQCDLSRSAFSLYRLARGLKLKAHENLSSLRPA